MTKREHLCVSKLVGFSCIVTMCQKRARERASLCRCFKIQLKSSLDRLVSGNRAGVVRLFYLKWIGPSGRVLWFASRIHYDLMNTKTQTDRQYRVQSVSICCWHWRIQNEWSAQKKSAAPASKKKINKFSCSFLLLIALFHLSGV